MNTKSGKSRSTTVNMSKVPNRSENQSSPDGNIIVAGLKAMKVLDANRYATKKTIAQGMLDIALLTANASQLKYILQVGHKHEFYTLMLSLIVTSILLQVVSGMLEVFLGSKLNINKQEDQETANKANNVCLALCIIEVAINIIISAFDMRDENLIQRALSINGTIHG